MKTCKICRRRFTPSKHQDAHTAVCYACQVSVARFRSQRQLSIDDAIQQNRITGRRLQVVKHTRWGQQWREFRYGKW